MMSFEVDAVGSLSLLPLLMPEIAALHVVTTQAFWLSSGSGLPRGSFIAAVTPLLRVSVFRRSPRPCVGIVRDVQRGFHRGQAGEGARFWVSGTVRKVHDSVCGCPEGLIFFAVSSFDGHRPSVFGIVEYFTNTSSALPGEVHHSVASMPTFEP
jgi:hypothetical protein